jgi:hypothetical protein
MATTPTTIYDLIDAQNLRRNAGYFAEEDDYSASRQISFSYFLQQFSIKVKTNENVSLIEVFESMEIYEDIFSSAIYGSVMVNDSSGGFSKYGITGGEMLTLVACKSVDNTDVIIDRDDLLVYQVTDFQMIDQKLSSFRLHFISKTAAEAEKKRLFRTFQGERRISALTTEIYKMIGSESNLYMDLDDGKCRIDNDFVCSGYTPLTAIENLARRACISGDYYLFFERLNKYNGKKHIMTSTKVMKSVETEINIMYNVTTRNFTPGGNTYRATQISFVDNYNHMQNMMSGMYNSNIKILDILGRDYVDVNVNYTNDTTTSQNSLESSNYFSQYQNFYPEQPGERIIARSYNDMSTNSGAWLKVDIVNGVILSMFRLIVDMPGNNLIGCGNYVSVIMPSGYAMALNVGSGIVPTDPVYSGKYLVTAVKHLFTNKEYRKKVEVSRIENEFNFDTAINQAGG